MDKVKSPYSASFTACSFMMYEMNRMLPLFLDDNAEKLVRQEIEQNKMLMVNSVATRKKYCLEFRRRFNVVPKEFWTTYQTWNEAAQRLGLFYVLLATYRILLDFHLNVTLKKWNSVDHRVFSDDIAMELLQIASTDKFVDSWSDCTKRRVVSAYLTFLNQAGLYDKKTGALHQAKDVSIEDYGYYVNAGLDWFLEACLLYNYEIDKVKETAL